MRRAMRANGWGRIVNVSSGIVAQLAAMLRANAYATSKAALEAHTVNLAAELAGAGVTVNAFRPGEVDTAMQAWIPRAGPGPDRHRTALAVHRVLPARKPDQPAAVRPVAACPSGHRRHRADLGRF